MDLTITQNIIIGITGGISVFGCMFLFFFGIFFPAFKISPHPLNDERKENLKEFYNMKPILNIIESNISNLFNESYFPLFGKYKGLNGGHAFKNCDKLFEGTCLEDKEKNEDKYCPTDEDGSKLDWKTCVDYIPIPEVNYIHYIHNNEKYYYSEKINKTNEMLFKMTVKEKEKCPENTKNCGILSLGSRLCFNIEDECPINDIIINRQSEYIDNNIIYKSLKMKENEYLHYTNEKTDNQIIFDLILSLEHPLSIIETSKKKYFNIIYKLCQYENEYYYKGNINNIKSLKKIYNTNKNYKELIQLYNIYNLITSEPTYKTEYFSSNIFLYKKYSIPLLKATYQEIEQYDKDILISYIFNYLSAVLLCPLGMSLFSIHKYPNTILFYLGVLIIDGLISFFFFFKFKCLTSNIFEDNYVFKEANTDRKRLLGLHSSYFSLTIIHNFAFVYIWICKKYDDYYKKN